RIDRTAPYEAERHRVSGTASEMGVGPTSDQSAFPENSRGAGAEDGLLIDRSSAFELSCEFAHLYAARVTSEGSGDVPDSTLREFAAGQKLFSRYTLIKILGRGGMGIVWLGRDEELEREVALKFLPDLILQDRAVLSDLKRETRRSLELTHPHIIRIHDFVHDERSGCISMEYVDGETLAS